MLRYLILLISLTSLVHCEDTTKEKDNVSEFKPVHLKIQRSIDQTTAQQHQNQEVESRTNLKSATQKESEQQSTEPLSENKNEKPLVSARQQHIVQQYAPVAFIEPQFQYPGYSYYQGKQPLARGQPQIVVYGPGQGQPILINPGSPPGNFLVPQQPQPGPNFVLRDQGPVFLAGYPKPAHIPPIEKDAEEIPTNPAKIPPLPTNKGKPEKLETLNEGKVDIPNNSAGEVDVLDEADKKSQSFPKSTNLKPGQRYFFMNGEPLFQNYAFQNDIGLPNFDARYEQALFPTKQELDLQYNTYPFQALLLRSEIPKDAQGHFINPNQQSISDNQADLKKDQVSDGQPQQKDPQQNIQYPQQIIPQQNFFIPEFGSQRIPFQFQPQFPNPNSISQTGNQPQSDADQSNAPQGQQLQPQFPQFLSQSPQFQTESRTLPQEAFFRSGLPFGFDGVNQDFGGIGQFRFPPPSDPYYPNDGEDIENDSIVINANLEDASSDSDTDKSENDAASPSDKSSDPSTAQASPGAIALAGQGGVAGAAPKATALAGKGGLAVSSPQATAVAGTRRDKDKVSTDKTDKSKV